MLQNDSLFHDRLTLFGFGIFETLLISEKGPLFLDLHWQRMSKGAKFLNLELPEINEWLNRIQEFIELTPTSAPYALRITLSGGSPTNILPSQLLIHERPLNYTPAQYESGIRLHVLSSPRNERSPLATIKSTNYLENILAKKVANDAGADEGLWLNTMGYISEGTMSNLFFFKDKSLYTPSLTNGCLPGTRRYIILTIARELKIPTFEGNYTLADLMLADEVFMTNALMGIMPVSHIDDVRILLTPQEQESDIRKIQTAFQEYINKAWLAPDERC